MQNLSLNDLIQYYNGFDFTSGNTKIFGNYSYDDSKSMAYNEIQYRAIQYRIQNQVPEKTNRIKELARQLDFPTKIGKVLFFDTTTGYEVRELANNIAQHSFAVTKQELIVFKNELSSVKAELNAIWVNDPDNLRYQSKYNSQGVCDYFPQTNIQEYALFTKNHTFIIERSPELHREKLMYMYCNFFESDIIIFPLYYIEEQKIEILLELLNNNDIYSKIWIIINESMNHETVLQRVLQTRIKPEQIHSFNIGKIVDLVGLSQLLEKIDNFATFN